MAQGSLLLFAEILGGETARDTGGGGLREILGGGAVHSDCTLIPATKECRNDD